MVAFDVALVVDLALVGLAIVGLALVGLAVDLVVAFVVRLLVVGNKVRFVVFLVVVGFIVVFWLDNELRCVVFWAVDDLKGAEEVHAINETMAKIEKSDKSNFAKFIVFFFLKPLLYIKMKSLKTKIFNFFICLKIFIQIRN